MRGPGLSISLWRRWVPLVLCLIGIGLLIGEHFDLFGVSAFAAFDGAGLSVLLTNLLVRIGVAGDSDRTDEEDARRYLAEHGRWPTDTSSDNWGLEPRPRTPTPVAPAPTPPAAPPPAPSGPAPAGETPPKTPGPPRPAGSAHSAPHKVPHQSGRRHRTPRR